MGKCTEQFIRFKIHIQCGFTFIETMVSLAVVAVLASLAVPFVSGVISTSQSSAIAQLFQENLRQARYASRVNASQNIVFCALTTVNRFRCQLDGLGGANPETRTQFSQGWQWFIDTQSNKQYNIGTDTLLGNTIEVKDRNINASSLYAEEIIALNAITFSNGETKLRSTNNTLITPTITFSKNSGKMSAVIFNRTGRTTFSPQYSIGGGPQGAESSSDSSS